MIGACDPILCLIRGLQAKISELADRTAQLSTAMEKGAELEGQLKATQVGASAVVVLVLWVYCGYGVGVLWV